MATFLVSIVWIGFSLDPDFDFHVNLLDEKTEEINDEGKEAEESEYYRWMELTAYGEPICINEYATKIAALKSTHVIQLDDF